MKSKPPGARLTHNKLKALDGITRPLVRKALKGHNTLLTQVLLDWSSIVSEQYSAVFTPLKTRFNPKTEETTLMLVTSSPQGAFLLRYDHDRIVAEINTFFGGTVIHRLTIGELRPLQSPALKRQRVKSVSLEEALVALQSALETLHETPKHGRDEENSDTL